MSEETITDGHVDLGDTDSTGTTADAIPAGHKLADKDAHYDVIFHPAFASACTVQKKGDAAARDLYRQGTAKSDVVHCPEGHPTRHVVRLKGKGNRRDITITIEDPDHSLHKISLDLYPEGRDPRSKQPVESTETFTVENHAITCPPHCET